MAAKNKPVGLMPDFYKELTDFAQEVGMHRTEVLRFLFDQRDEFNWKDARDIMRGNRRTLGNLARDIEEYELEDHTSEEISERLGYSIRQVDVVTLRVHRRCIAVVRETPNITCTALMKAADASEATAKHVLQCMRGEKKIPRRELCLEYL